MERAAKAIDRDPVDATLTIAEDGALVTTTAVEGRVVDQQAILAALDAQLVRLETPGEIRMDIPFTTQTPATETADVVDAVAAADRMTADLVLTRGDGQLDHPVQEAAASDLVLRHGGRGDRAGRRRGGHRPALKPIAKGPQPARRNADFRLERQPRWSCGNGEPGGAHARRRRDDALIVDALDGAPGGRPTATLKPVVAAVEPALTTAEAAGRGAQDADDLRVDDLVPDHETNGFGANIWIPARLIDGYVVGPGETFDFWDAVGPVTRAKGYKRRRRDHQRQDRAPGRARRRDLLVLDDAVQRGAPGRLRDGRAAQPLLLHRPLPDRAGRHRVHQRRRLGPDDVVDERHRLPGPHPRLQDPRAATAATSGSSCTASRPAAGSSIGDADRQERPAGHGHGPVHVDAWRPA